jgi:hypothetical protein
MIILTGALSFVALAWCAATHPTAARCPSGWHVATLKPSGAFACALTPERRVCDSKGGCDDDKPDPEVRGRLYCTGGAVPIQGTDGRAVGCMRTGR